MSMFDSFLDFSAGISSILGEVFLAEQPQKLIDIVGTEDDETFIVKGACYLTLIEVNGALGSVGDDEYSKITKRIHSAMKKIMQDDARHEIKVWFESDPDQAKQILEENFSPTKAHIKKCGMDLDVLYNEKIAVNAPHVQKERVFVGIYTHKNKKVDDVVFEGAGVAIGATQVVFKCESMLNYHKEVIASFVNSVADILSIKITRVDDVLRDIYSAINGTSSAKRVMFDKLFLSNSDKRSIKDLENLPKLKVKSEKFTNEVVRRFGREVSSLNNKSLSVLMPEPLSEQLISGAIYDEGYGHIICGSRIYAPLTAHGFGVDQKDFDFLVRNLRGLPFRMSFTITPKGLDMSVFEGLALSLVGAFNESTRMKSRSLSAMQKIKLSESIVGLSINACTWAPLDKRVDIESGKSYYDTSLLLKRIERIKSATNDWCGLKLGDCAGDSVESFFSTLPGLIGRHVGKRATAPLEDVVHLLPISRIGSVWDSGAILFRTDDGRPFPFEQMSSKQASDVIVITGDMGSGKSSMMSALDLAFVAQPSDTDSLPYLRGIEFGYSQKGVVEAVKAGLGPEDEHKAVYTQMQNSRKYAVNGHDLPLGSRYPTQSHREYLINLLMTITDSMSDFLNHAGLCGTAIDLAYKLYSDEEGNPQAKRYKPNVDTIVDEHIERLGLQCSEETTWFGLCDLIFFTESDGHGYHPYAWVAARAQRYAVPTIEDYQSIANSQELSRDYAHDYKGMPVCKQFALSLREVVASIPMICGYTAFDVSESPVYIVDLKDLIPSGKQPRATEAKSAIVYMAVMRALSSDFFVDETVLPLFNPRYRAYHAIRVARIVRCKKRFFVDEKHRINGIQAAVNAIDAIVFEGRKFRVSVIQGSQLLTHISPAIIKLATTVINCGSSSPEEVEEAKERYSLTDHHCNLIKNLAKPSAAGAEFFVRFRLGSGFAFAKLINTEGPTMLCLVATESDDRTVREGLIKIAKVKSEAWKAYAAEFPSGRVRGEIERIKRLQDEGAYESRTNDLIKDIILRVAEKHGLAA